MQSTAELGVGTSSPDRGVSTAIASRGIGGRAWWIGWVVATTVATPVSLLVWQIAYTVLFFLLGGAWFTITARFPVDGGHGPIWLGLGAPLLGGVLAGSIAGVPLGSAQWLVLRYRVPWARRWLGATMLGAALAGAVVAILMQARLSPLLGAWGASTPTVPADVRLWAPIAFLTGCGFGLGQWQAFRGWVPRASLWVPIMGCTWTLSSLALSLPPSSGSPIYGLVGLAVVVVGPAAISGGALLALVRGPVAARSRRDGLAVAIGTLVLAGAMGLVWVLNPGLPTLHPADQLLREAGELAGRAQHPEALVVLDQALVTYRADGNATGEREVIHRTGDVYMAMRDYERALDAYRQMLALSRATSERAWEAHALRDIGLVYAAMGQSERALEQFDPALAISREVGHRYEEAATLQALARSYAQRGETVRAAQYYEQTLAVHRELQFQDGETLEQAAQIYFSLGQPERALAYFEEVRELGRAFRGAAGETKPLMEIAAAHAALGQSQRALDAAQRALAIYRETGDRLATARTLHWLGAYHRSLGQTARARATLSEALAIFQELGDRAGEESVRRTLDDV